MASLLRHLWVKATACVASWRLAPMSLRLWALRAGGMQVGADVHVFEGVRYLHGRVTLGDRSMIAQDVFLQDHAEIAIGQDAWIGPRCTLLTQTHEIGGSNLRASGSFDRPVMIGTGCWLGANVTVLPGVIIGDGCVVGAGAVVTRDCEPNGLYVGAPAIRKRDLD